MGNVRLNEAQIGIKFARRNIINLRYADDTTLNCRKRRGTKEPLDESERGEWKMLAWGWCTGTTQRDGMGREEGGGFRMGNTCIPVADSF